MRDPGSTSMDAALHAPVVLRDRSRRDPWRGADLDSHQPLTRLRVLNAEIRSDGPSERRDVGEDESNSLILLPTIRRHEGVNDCGQLMRRAQLATRLGPCSSATTSSAWLTYLHEEARARERLA